jgi:hypothetical protein
MENSATPEQAAAIAAAIERFAAEAAPAATGSAEGVDPWTRAALLEGVGAKRTIQDLEGGMR